MSTPTPDDRQAAEWAKNKCMDMTTPETDAAEVTTDDVCNPTSSYHTEWVRAEFARKLERERDELRAALSTALRERESARQAISMADGTLVQIIADRDELRSLLTQSNESFIAQIKALHQVHESAVNELAIDRDAWKAKAERKCISRKRACPESKATYWEYSCGLESYYDVGAPFCDHCGGRIVKEGE